MTSSGPLFMSIRCHILPLLHLMPPQLGFFCGQIVSLASSAIYSDFGSFLGLMIGMLLGGNEALLPTSPGFLLAGGTRSAGRTSAEFPILLNGQSLIKWSLNTHAKHILLAIRQLRLKCLGFWQKLHTNWGREGWNVHLASGTLIVLIESSLSICRNVYFTDVW